MDFKMSDKYRKLQKSSMLKLPALAMACLLAAPLNAAGVDDDIPSISGPADADDLKAGLSEYSRKQVSIQDLEKYTVAAISKDIEKVGKICDHPSEADNATKLKRRGEVAAKTEYRRTEHSFNVPNLGLVSMDGDRVSMSEMLNTQQPVMMNFIFTTCTTICPVLSATFSEVQEQLGDEAKGIKMISISIDPEYDSPEKLKAYSKRFNAGEQWEFYTGDVMAIIGAQKAFRAYRGAKMNHDPLTFIRASDDSKWIRLEGIASAGDIVNEYKKLVME
ncbi:MAG: SCO family protein [Candidatus Sedimenticola sp. 20ELBAFRAG]